MATLYHIVYTRPTMNDIVEKLSKKKSYVVFFVVFVLLVIFFERSCSHEQKMTISQQGIVLSSNDLAKVKKENFFIQVPISGELYPLEQTTIVAKVGAEVKNVFVREGESVRKNQWLAQLDTADLEQAVKDKEGALAASKASYLFSVSALERYKKLLQKKYYSQNDYDAALQQVRINQAGLTQATAALDEAKLQLGYAKIVSSLDGIVSQRDIEPGVNLSVGQVLFKIVNLDNLEWRAMVPADKITAVKENQVATFIVNGISRSFHGKVVRINPSTVAGTRAYYAYIAVNNADHELKNGMFATGSVILEEKKNALVVPVEAIRKNTDGETYVFKVDADQHIQKQKITLGLKDAVNNRAEVLSGLAVNDLIIASSAEIQSGNKVILPVSFDKK